MQHPFLNQEFRKILPDGSKAAIMTERHSVPFAGVYLFPLPPALTEASVLGRAADKKRRRDRAKETALMSRLKEQSSSRAEADRKAFMAYALDAGGVQTVDTKELLAAAREADAAIRAAGLPDPWGEADEADAEDFTGELTPVEVTEKAREMFRQALRGT